MFTLFTLSGGVLAQIGIVEWVLISIAIGSLIVSAKMLRIATKKYDIDVLNSKADDKDLRRVEKESKEGLKKLESKVDLKISRSEFMVHIDGIKQHIDDKSEEIMKLQETLHVANNREHDQLINSIHSMNESILVIKNTQINEAIKLTNFDQIREETREQIKREGT